MWLEQAREDGEIFKRSLFLDKTHIPSWTTYLPAKRRENEREREKNKRTDNHYKWNIVSETWFCNANRIDEKQNCSSAFPTIGEGERESESNDVNETIYVDKCGIIFCHEMSEHWKMFDEHIM